MVNADQNYNSDTPAMDMFKKHMEDLDQGHFQAPFYVW